MFKGRHFDRSVIPLRLGAALNWPKTCQTGVCDKLPASLN